MNIDLSQLAQPEEPYGQKVQRVAEEIRKILDAEGMEMYASIQFMPGQQQQPPTPPPAQ